MQARFTAARGLAVAAVWLGAGACTNTPVYVPSPNNLEVGTDDPADTGVATDTLILPYDGVFMNGATYQQRRADDLVAINAAFDPDITGDQLPYVKLDQIHLSIEWTIKNLDDQPGTARIQINGGNPYFYYVPDDFVTDPTDPNARVPPPLAGNIPIDVPALGTVDGVVREDTMREAALDLDLITRFGISPFLALLNLEENITSTADVPFVPFPPPGPDDPPPTPPPPFPIAAFANLVRVDVTFRADRHMVLEYAVRARDPDGLLHDDLLAADPAELMPFEPVEYVPPAPPP